MKATKPIDELVESPRKDVEDVHNEVADEAIELAGVHKQSLDMPAAKYRYIDISDSSFIDSFLNNVETFRAIILRVTFDSTQMTGLQLAEGAITDVVFNNCRINLSNFRNAKFRRCMFIDCDLREADFGGCKFENVLIENCQLEDAEFSNASSKRLEFSNCKLGAVKGASGLRGALIDEVNLTELAPLFAAEYMISIRE